MKWAEANERFGLARILSGCSFLAVVALWLVAFQLEPQSKGYGTHQQLGLGGCSILTWTGWPCPMCGMTTTFAMMAEGRWISALFNQPMGFLLALVSFAVGAVSAGEMFKPTGRWRRIWRRAVCHEKKVIILFVVLMISSWLYKIAVL